MLAVEERSKRTGGTVTPGTTAVPGTMPAGGRKASVNRPFVVSTAAMIEAVPERIEGAPRQFRQRWSDEFKDRAVG